MFRFACEGTKAIDRGAPIRRFLEGFDAFVRVLRSRASTLIAFEKDGYEARYEIASPRGLVAFDRSRLDDGDFAAMLG
jgi:hypothetical protein